MMLLGLFLIFLSLVVAALSAAWFRSDRSHSHRVVIYGDAFAADSPRERMQVARDLVRIARKRRRDKRRARPKKSDDEERGQ